MKIKVVFRFSQKLICTIFLLLLIGCSSVSHHYPPPPSQPSFGTKGVCFYNFTNVFYVRSVKMSDYLCSRQNSNNCLCYELKHTGSTESLETWLINNLRTSDVLTFEIKRTGNNILELWFDSGFK